MCNCLIKLTLHDLSCILISNMNKNLWEMHLFSKTVIKCLKYLFYGKYLKISADIIAFNFSNDRTLTINFC